MLLQTFSQKSWRIKTRHHKMQTKSEQSMIQKNNISLLISIKAELRFRFKGGKNADEQRKGSLLPVSLEIWIKASTPLSPQLPSDASVETQFHSIAVTMSIMAWAWYESGGTTREKKSQRVLSLSSGAVEAQLICGIWMEKGEEGRKMLRKCEKSTVNSVVFLNVSQIVFYCLHIKMSKVGRLLYDYFFNLMFITTINVFPYKEKKNSKK